MKKIQIHYRKPNGASGVMNYLWGDNVELLSSNHADRERKRKALKDKAARMASAWSDTYPDMQFRVVEV